jgi:hypothetical protein
VSGSGRVRLGDIRQWDVVRVAVDVIRAFEAAPDGLELIGVGGPKPEGGNGVRSDAPGPTAERAAIDGGRPQVGGLAA